MDGDDTIAARKAMVEEIAVEVAGTRNWLGKDSLDHRVMAAMAKVARHLFIPEASQPEASRKSAYANRPQPIGHGQTISQPYIVAVMTDMAAPGPNDRVLEIGSWLDYGMFIENIMVAARGRGLDTCPQVSFARYHKVLRKHLDIPDEQVVVCGMSIGYEDQAAPENQLVTEREPVEGFTRFFGL